MLDRLRYLIGLMLLLTVITGFGFGMGAAEPGTILDFSGPWEYRWEAGETWLPVDLPTNPPGRNGREQLLLRAFLPEKNDPDLVLFLPSVDTAFEAWVAGVPVYSYGMSGSEADPRFSGWPWHFVPVPEGSGRAPIEFLVSSSYRDIGLWGSPVIGRRSDLLLRMARRDAPRLLIAAALLTLSVLGSLVFLFGNPRRSYLLLMGISLLFVVRILADTRLKQLVLNEPLLWEFLESATCFALPGLLAFFLADILFRPFVRAMRFAGIVYLSVGTAGIGGALIGLYPIYLMYPISELLFGFFIVLYVTATFASVRRGNREAIILLVAFLLAAFFNIHDILVARSMLPWSDTTEHYMLFFFGVGLATVVAMRVAGIHAEVRGHAARLEQTVMERTCDLERANEMLEQEKAQLEIASTTDDLTGLYNRRYLQAALDRELRTAHRYGHPLSIIMMDLDFFKRLNDTLGHVEGDAVLREVADIIRGELRSIDFAARFGGEEFVITLPQTGGGGARIVAERIRSAVEVHQWNVGRNMTISGGIASVDSGADRQTVEDFFRSADEALYRAKESGRNRICW